MAKRSIPLWLMWMLRIAWALTRLLPASAVRFLARLLFSKSRARFAAAIANPEAYQLTTLLEILARNKNTDFGREHQFFAIADFDQYRKRVPIRGYDKLEPYIQRMVAGDGDVLVSDPVTFYARSSGTTGTPKYVPVTERYLDEMRACRRMWSLGVSQVFPLLVRGHFLTMHSPAIDGHTPGGIPFGSITVAMTGGTDDDIASPLEGVPRSIYLIEDFETKYYLVLRAALDLPIALMGALNPSTLVILCQRLSLWADQLTNDVERGEVHAPGEVPDQVMQRLRPRLRRRPAVARRIRKSLAQHGVVRVVDVWPKLCGVLTWKGGSAPFYLGKLRPYIGDLQIMDYGYAASEGSFNVVLDAGDGRGVVGVMGHVLEFVAEARHGETDPPTLRPHQLQVGQRYAVIITASNGLYRYDINDIVEVLDVWQGLPRIRFVHKGGNMISLTGEKLGEAHAIEAIDGALNELEVDAAGFLLTARLGDPSHYVIAVELESDLDDAAQRALLEACERRLRLVNIEYASKRDSQRLGSPHLCLCSRGVFEQLRVTRVARGAPDAHVKVPHLWSDSEVLQELGVIHELSGESG